MSRPRLVHVFSTFAAGGPQVRTVALLDALSESYDHVVVAMDGNREAAERFDPATRVMLLDAPDGVTTRNAPARMRRFLSGLSPDLVLTYNWGAIESIIAARLLRCPVVHHEDGFGPEEATSQLPRRVWTRRVLLRGVRRLVVPSRNLEGIARSVWWCPARKLIHLDNGIDLEAFRAPSSQTLRSEWGIPEGRLIVGTAAKLRAEKALDRLVDLVADLSASHDLHLVIVGDGPARADLERQVADRGIADRATFTGQVHQPATWFLEFDVFAMTSVTEQMPISVVEAMASGTPVFSTDVGDVASMVAEENRPYVVDSDDPDSWREPASDLLRDANLRVRLGVANRARANERYDVREMVRAYDGVYRAALGKAHPEEGSLAKKSERA